MIPGNPKEGQQHDAMIKQRQFCISSHGKELTQSLMDHILKVNKSTATENDILGLMRYLVGKEIADMLSIKTPELPGYKLTLTRTINLLKSCRPKGDSMQNYHKAYAAFKAQSREVSKRN